MTFGSGWDDFSRPDLACPSPSRLAEAQALENPSVATGTRPQPSIDRVTVPGCKNSARLGSGLAYGGATSSRVEFVV